MKKIFFAIAFIFSALSMNAADKVTITVSNPIGNSRVEMVEADYSQIKKKLSDAESIIITDADGKEIPSQVTYDGKIIFKAGVAGKGKSVYYAVAGTPQEYETKVRGRLFFERDTEFGWENDCVAYRIYGEGQAVGYDVFNKSTSELMLDYWYASEQNEEMRYVSQELRERGYNDLADQVYNAYCYHINHGKGMDCYTVGHTLGAGANAIINENDSLLLPKCYSDYKILDKGPLRFTVKLTNPENYYNSEEMFVQQRIISLDAGSRFCKVDVSYIGIHYPISMAAGIVVHKQNPSAYVQSSEGYIGYEDLGDASVYNAKYRAELEKQMGKIYIGLLFPSKKVKYLFKECDNGIATGHILAKDTFIPGTEYTYYFGSGWSENKETNFKSLTDWEAFLNTSSKCVRNPLKVNIK